MRKVMTQNMTDIALRMSNMGLKQFNEVNHNKFVDLKKATGHMSQKQMEYLRVFSANYVNCLILSSELKDQEVADTFLDNMQMLKCIVPF
jgi:steroid 5-alpha reductase family enzyme|tara:strand:+ start:412 stop:681 length:270 start_codon:yes stop_codon:yes gene_type:complete